MDWTDYQWAIVIGIVLIAAIANQIRVKVSRVYEILKERLPKSQMELEMEQWEKEMEAEDKSKRKGSGSLTGILCVRFSMRSCYAPHAQEAD